MQMRVARLRQTLKYLEPAVPKKPTLAVLKNVLLKDGKATATNLEIAVFIDLPEAKETCLLPFKEMSELLEVIPGTLDLTIEVEKNNIHLFWDGGKAAFPTADPRDFPDLNRHDAPTIISDVDGTALIKGIISMVPYASEDETKPVLHGVTLYLGEKVAAAAADGFRLVYNPLPISFGTGGTVIIPTETVNILNYLWDKTPVMVSLKSGLIEQLLSKRMLTLAVGKDNEWIGFKFGVAKVLSKLILGNPPDHKSLIPTPTNRVQVLGPDFALAVLRTKRIALAGAGIVRMKWTEKEMEVYASAADIGDVSTKIDASALDGPSHIAIDYKYLMEYLKGKDGLVTIGISTKDTRPVLFEYPSTPITLVMPKMVEWD